MADAAKAYGAFDKKQEDALKHILEEVRQVSGIWNRYYGNSTATSTACTTTLTPRRRLISILSTHLLILSNLTKITACF